LNETNLHPELRIHIQEIQGGTVDPTRHPLTVPVRTKQGEEGEQADPIGLMLVCSVQTRIFLPESLENRRQANWSKRHFPESQQRCQRSGTEAKNYLIVSIIMKMIAYKKMKTCMADHEKR